MSQPHATPPQPSQPTSAPTTLPIVAALVSLDTSYEDKRPVLVRPIVLTSAGLRVRHFDGSPDTHEDFDGEQFSLWADEKPLAVLPLRALLVQSSGGGWAFQPEDRR